MDAGGIPQISSLNLSDLCSNYKLIESRILTIKDLQTELLNFKKLKKPIIITDPSDNVGGGALGNNTEILEILLKNRLSGTIMIWAPYLKGKIYKMIKIFYR
jgi:microcystin degradation protein MlrC